jgi:hypothetical protein
MRSDQIDVGQPQSLLDSAQLLRHNAPLHPALARFAYVETGDEATDCRSARGTTMAELSWTEAQWQKVNEAVSEAFAKASVASAFLPCYGPLPGSAETSA